MRQATSLPTRQDTVPPTDAAAHPVTTPGARSPGCRPQADHHQTTPTPPPAGTVFASCLDPTTTTETLEVAGPPGAMLTVGTPPSQGA